MSSADFETSNQNPILSKNPIKSPGQLGINQNVKNARYLVDSNGDLWTLLVQLGDWGSGNVFDDTNVIGDNILNTPPTGVVDLIALVKDTLYNRTTNVWERNRNNEEIVVAANDTTNGTFTSSDYINYNARGLIAFFNVSSLTGTSWTPAVLAKDPGSGEYFQLHANVTPIVSATSAAILIYPGAGLAAGNITTAQGFPLPRTFRLTVSKTAVTGFAASYAVALIL